MEVLTERLSKGTLQHLQSLERQAHELSHAHGGESRVKQERMVRALQKAAHRLQERRDLLKVRIAQSPNKVLVPVLTGVDLDNSEALTKAVKEVAKSSSGRKSLQVAVREAAKLKHKELSVSYRLTGCTVHKMENNCIRIRWDTFDLGEYLQPYYAVVAMTTEDQNLQLRKHNLPYFLPVKDLVAEHLNSDLQGFVRTVGDYLNAFVSRKRQTEEAMEKCSRFLDEKITTSNAFNSVWLTVSKPRSVAKPLDLQLVYDDLRESRPTKVTIQTDGKLTRQQQSVVKDIFSKKRIAEAILEIFQA